MHMLLSTVLTFVLDAQKNHDLIDLHLLSTVFVFFLSFSI